MFHLSHVFREITKLRSVEADGGTAFSSQLLRRLKQGDQVQRLLGLKSEFMVSLGSFLRPCLKVKILESAG